MTAGMIGQADVTDLEIAGTDTPKETDLPTDDDEEVENIETGEIIPMKGQEDAARTLLTHGPVAELMIAVQSHPADQWQM